MLKALFAIGLAIVPTARAVAPSQANVITMLWDDWGWNGYGMYSSDMGANADWDGVTPNADVMAVKGSRSTVTTRRNVARPPARCS